MTRDCFTSLFILLACLLITSQSVAQQSASELKPARLQLLWKHQFEFAGYYAAKQQGFYRDAGLDVEIMPFAPGDELPVDRIMQGQAEFAVGDASIILDRAQGKPVKLLANIFQHNPLVLVALAESGIQSPAQMIGKRVMLAAHEIASPVISAMLAVESVELEQMQIIDHSFTIDPLISGDVDVMSAYMSNEPGLFRQRDIRINIIHPINYGIDSFGSNIYTHEYTLRNDTQTVDAFVEASLKGWEYALQFPDRIIELIRDEYSQEKSREELEYEAEETRKLILPGQIMLGDINRTQLDRIVAIYKQLKAIPDDFNSADLLIDSALATNYSANFSIQEKHWLKNNQSIVLGVDPSWAPFEFIDEEGKYSGMAADYMQLIRDRTGLSFQVQDNASWDQVLKSAKAGKVDVLPAIVRSEQRSEYLNFTAPYMTYPMVIVTDRNSAFISNMNDLNGQNVIVVKSHISEDILRRNHPQYNLVLATNVNQALEMLSSGDGDAFVDNLASVTHSIIEQGFKNLRISGRTPYNFELSIGVPRGNPQLLGILQKSIDSISDDEKKTIRDKWISVSVPSSPDYYLILEISLIVLLILSIILFWNRKLAREIGRRKQFERELIKSAQRFRDLFENNKAVELIVDPKSKSIIAANNAAIRYYGYSYSEIQQMSMLDINVIPEQELDREMKLAVDNKRSHFFFQHRLCSGEIRDVEVHSGPIDWGGQPLLYSIVHDITDRVKAEKALIEAKAEAEAATRVKSEFLANMSHEIRTPMNSVLGMAELLNETPLNDEQKNLLSILQSSGNALIAIINDILDFSKLEANKMPLDYVSFQLLPFIEEVLDSLRMSAREKHIRLNSRFAANTDIEITSDPTRLRQILINLLANAIKFTEQGSVTMSVQVEKTSNDLCQLIFQVIDTGIGMKKSELPSLFDSFTQAEQSTTRKFGGTGLGLAITEKLVKLLKGSVQVSSIPDSGSTFTVQLPTLYRPLSAEEIAARHKTITAADHVRLQFRADILVAEDVKPNRILMEKMLAKFGVSCQFAENGQQAVDMEQNYAFDLILMDCQMPVMDGYTATARIRESNPAIPILAVTANVSQDDLRRAETVGINEVLTKPLQLSELEKALRHWLDHSKQMDRPYARPGDAEMAIHEPVDTAAPIINIDTLERLKAEMDEVFEEVYQSVFSSIESSISALQQQPADSETITRLLHSIKSPAASLGAERLQQLVGNFENQSSRNELGDLDDVVRQLRQAFCELKHSLLDFTVKQ